MGREQDLLDASRSGHYAVVEKVLSARIKKSGPLTLTSLRRLPGPNTTDPRNGFTCLHYASLNGHKDIVHLLLEHGANPNIADHNGSSPLHLASWTGDYEVVNMLIVNANQKADINLKNKDNETALHSACQYGHTAVVSLLLTQGADPFIRNIRSETPLDLASQYGRLDTIELLLQMRFDLLKDYLPINRDPVMATTHGHYRLPHSPLHLASRNGHKQVVKLLLDLGFDVDFLTANGTALHEAVLCGKVEVVRMLLDAGSDIFMENDKGQKVDELLNGLNTSVAKQTKKMIQEHMHALVSNRSIISPVSESTTIAASINSYCDPTEDLTIVDSMLQEDMAMYQHEFEDLMDETDVQCISPPPGYTDVPPPDAVSQLDNDLRHHNQHQHLPDPHHLDVECVSPSSSVFSSSILSELQSIFDEHLNRNSADERNSQEFTEDPFGGLKPSTSFTLSDYRQQAQHRTSATSDIVAHHQSFDAVYLNSLHPLDGARPLMSTSLTSNENFGNPLGKRYQTDSSREAMQSSNYSLSSSASQDTRSGNAADALGRPRPPKPPRKTIGERSKAKSLESGRMLVNNFAKSDFNVDYAAADSDDEERSVPSQRQVLTTVTTTNDQADSDHSSAHLNSVISNDKEKPKTKAKTTKANSGDKAAVSGGHGSNNNGAANARNGPGASAQSITFTQSIDDFYMLYDQVANSASADKSPAGRGRQLHKSTGNSKAKKHSSSLDDILADSGVAISAIANPQPTNPPSPRSAESDIFQAIEPLKQQFQQLQPPVRRKRKKKQTEPNSTQCQTSDQQPRPTATSATTKRDNWTLTDFPAEVPVAEPTSPSNTTSPRKRSVAVWTVEAGNRENSSLVANRVQVKKKVMTDGRKTSEASPARAAASEIGPGNGNGSAKSEYYNAYCETLKFDRKGEKGNPFAGLCRGGLTPAKSNLESSKNAHVPAAAANGPKASERKKKTVELSEARKSLRGKRAILSGRAESLTKLSKLSVYQESTSTGTDVDTSGPVPNIYATLRKAKKKCKSLNGDQMPTIAGKVASCDGASAKSGLVGSESWNNLLKAQSAKGQESAYGTAGRPDSSVQQTHQLYLWLKENGMEQYKDLLISNGYDNLNFMDANVMDDSDLLEIGIINAAHREVILKAAQQLPKTSPKLTKAEIKTLTVPEWLSMLHLDQYKETFHRNGMDELRKVHNIWEVELETMLEIDKSGYRRRIMYSLSDFNRESILMDDDDIASWLTDVQSSNDTEKEDGQNGGKKPWKEWKHSRQELVSGCCQYSVRYLGSTLVRELRGIDSTRASMGKLKSAHAKVPPMQIPKIILSISCQGVQFRDFKSNHLICEHEIRNIHCICQDSEDLTYFAYITKDLESNNHYCHVFMSQQTELVTEIILTLGQAFEIAYQIVLEQYNIYATAANEVQITNNIASNNGTSNLTPSSASNSNSNGKSIVAAPSASAKKPLTNSQPPTQDEPEGSKAESGSSSAYSTYVKSTTGRSATETTTTTTTNVTAGPTDCTATTTTTAAAGSSSGGPKAGSKLSLLKHKQIASGVLQFAAKLKAQEELEASREDGGGGGGGANDNSANHKVSTVKYESHREEGEGVRQRGKQQEPVAACAMPVQAAANRHQSADSNATSKLTSAAVGPAVASVVSEDIYAVVDKSKKARKKSITDLPAAETGSTATRKSSQDLSAAPESRPVPPVRSSSTAGTTGRPEIKPKPPMRVASMQKPEVSPKPKNLNREGATPTPPLHAHSFGRGSIKPSIAARQAQLISCTSPQPPMTPSPAPSH